MLRLGAAAYSEWMNSMWKLSKGVYKMKKKLVLFVALGMSFAPVLFAGSSVEQLGQLKSSQTSSAGIKCGDSLDKSVSAISADSIRSTEKSGARIIK